MKITLISDTHNKHKLITQDLPGGDLLIHAGDISSMGYEHEIREFCKWYNSLDNYTNKVFIAGNHDWGFQINTEKVKEILDFYGNITYLQDNEVLVGEKLVSIYGSPWQPEFYNWAFNLPRKGDELKEKWDNIPSNTDILITHGPAYGYVDKASALTHIPTRTTTITVFLREKTHQDPLQTKDSVPLHSFQIKSVASVEVELVTLEIKFGENLG